MSAPTPEAVAQHARDLRVCSVYADLCDWIEHAFDQSRGLSPEAKIAASIHTELFELKRRLEPRIERLAVAQAELEAGDGELDLSGLSGRDLVEAFEGATDQQISAALGERAMGTL